MQLILRTFLYIIVSLTLVLPVLVFDGLFFPFITSKAFLFRVLVELGVITLALLALVDARYIPRITLPAGIFVLFLGILFIANMFGVDPVRSMWSNFERMEGWVTLVHLFGLFLILERIFSIQDFFYRFIQISLGVSVLVGAHGLLQLAGVADIHQSGVRLDANFGNAAYLAVYTLFHIFFAALLFFRAQALPLRVLYGGIALLNFILLYFSGTRGTLIALVAGAGVSLLVYAILTRSKKVFAILVGFFILVSVLFGTLVAYKDSAFVSENSVLTRVATISLSEGETRFRIWNIALQGFLERPLLGWGQGNFISVFGKYYNPQLYNQEPWFDRTHNIVFDWLIAGGILGLLAYLLLFGSVVWAFVIGKFGRLEKAVVLGLLAGYFVNNLFVFDNLMSYILFIALAAWGSSSLIKQYHITLPQVPKEIGASLVIILGLAAMYFVNVPALNTNAALIRALSPQYSLEERRLLFAEARSYGVVGRQEVAEQMAQLAFRAYEADTVSPQIKGQLLLDAAYALQEEVVRVPENPRTHLLFGIALRLLGEYERAYEVLGKARDLAPRKQDILWEYALAAEALGKKEEALEVFKYAYELAPENEQARLIYETVQEALAKE